MTEDQDNLHGTTKKTSKATAVEVFILPSSLLSTLRMTNTISIFYFLFCSSAWTISQTYSSTRHLPA